MARSAGVVLFKHEKELLWLNFGQHHPGCAFRAASPPQLRRGVLSHDQLLLHFLQQPLEFFQLEPASPSLPSDVSFR